MDFKELMKAEKAAMLRDVLLNTKVDKKIDVIVNLVEENETTKSESASRTPCQPQISQDFELQFSQPLETHKLSCPIESIYYVPDCVSEEASRRILKMINSSNTDNAGQVVPENLSLWRTLGSEWTQLKARKLQQWGRMIRGPEDTGTGTAKEGNDTEPEHALPAWLQSLSQELVRVGIFSVQEAPNHVLVNDYKPQGGILHHTDGPFYHPNVAILSIGGPMLLTFRKRLTTDQIAASSGTSHPAAAAEGGGGGGAKDLYSVLLQSNSLLVFRENLYSDYLHGIADGSFFETIDANSMPQPQPQARAGAETSQVQADVKCVCLNKATARVVAGQRVERHKRTSLTFRRTR